MAFCGRCKKEKCEAEFYPSSLKQKTGLWCKPCRVEYSRKRVLEDRDHFLKYQRKRRRTVLDQLAELRVEKGCKVCGEKHIAVLSFHHRDEKEKSFNISQMASRNNRTMERLLEEIAKCDVLCENCHRKLHWSERTGGYGGANRDPSRPKLKA